MKVALTFMEWKDYIAMGFEAQKLIGVPTCYTISPGGNRCVVWPSPEEGINIFAEIKEKIIDGNAK